jgi:hypothetical protein
MNRRLIMAIALIAATAAFATPALAGKGGSHSSSLPSASCTVNGNTVSATGLPTDQVINFMITDPTSAYGWVLGMSDNGLWSLEVPARTGPTTYEFASKTWGPAGSKYTVFAACSA